MTAAIERWGADEEEAARRLDVAIDELLRGRADPRDADVGSLEGIVGMLGARLPRLHPRFGFEERLAQRLRSEMADAEGTVLQFPPVERAPGLAARIDRAWRPGRWSLVGAVASAIPLAITLAGAALVVLWRRARGSDRSEGIA